MTKKNETPQKRGHPPWTEEQKQARRELMAQKRGTPASAATSVSTYLKRARESLGLPPIDITDPEQVAQRINDYFDDCEATDRQPNLAGLSNWLGVSRATLQRWRRGDFSKDQRSAVIQRAVSIIEETLVSQVQEEKKNPASGIFLLKAMFQYREQQDIVITTRDGSEDDLTLEEIQRRYLPDEKTVETTFVEDEEQKTEEQKTVETVFVDEPEEKEAQKD